jgi:hypothetical protein
VVPRRRHGRCRRSGSRPCPPCLRPPLLSELLTETFCPLPTVTSATFTECGGRTSVFSVRESLAPATASCENLPMASCHRTLINRIEHWFLRLISLRC